MQQHSHTELRPGSRSGSMIVTVSMPLPRKEAYRAAQACRERPFAIGAEGQVGSLAQESPPRQALRPAPQLDCRRIVQS
jgi:hypothetical protein